MDNKTLHDLDITIEILRLQSAFYHAVRSGFLYLDKGDTVSAQIVSDVAQLAIEQLRVKSKQCRTVVDIPELLWQYRDLMDKIGRAENG